MSIGTFGRREFEALGDAERNSLTFLRGLRDGLARELLASAGGGDPEDEGPGEWMEDLVMLRWMSHSAHKLEQGFLRGGDSLSYEQVGVLVQIVKRIARLEREGCGVRCYGDLECA